MIKHFTLTEDKPICNIVPFEYYDSLVSDEVRQDLVDLSNLSKEVFEIRKKQIDYIIELGDRFEQRNLTIHTAVTYLDKALVKYSHMLAGRARNHKSSDEHSNLWAAVCLMLASKYDEIDKKIPFYKQFIKASTRAAVYTKEQFHVVEEFFLKKVLKWDLNAITTLHFTYCLSSQGILFEDDQYSLPLERVLKSLKKKTELFSDLSLDSKKLNLK